MTRTWSEKMKFQSAAKYVGKKLKKRIIEWCRNNNIQKRKAISAFAEELSTRCGTIIDTTIIYNWISGRRIPEKYTKEINDILNEPADKIKNKFDIEVEILIATLLDAKYRHLL